MSPTFAAFGGSNAPSEANLDSPDCPEDAPKVHLEAQSAPGWRLGPSEVLISLQRGIKITKSDFSEIFDHKVGPESLKCLQNDIQTRPWAPTGVPSVSQVGPKWHPKGPKSHNFDLIWATFSDFGDTFPT